MLTNNAPPKRPGFSICAGPDSMLLRRRAEELLAAWPAQEAWERRVFWADEGLPAEFWEALTLQGLFAAPKALVLRQAQALPAAEWRELSQALGRRNDAVWPFIFLEVDFEKGKPKIPAHIAKLGCLAFAEKQGWLEGLPGLGQGELPGFIKAEAQRLGLTMASGAPEALSRVMPRDATAIGLEMSKLALASKDGSIRPEAAELLTASRDLDIFTFIRLIQRGDNPAAVWEQYFKDAQGSERNLFSFLGMLLREARILWQILSGEPVFLPPQAIAQAKSLARGLGYPGLARIWDLALRADKSVKTGEASPDQAQELLLADLFRLFGRSN